MEAAATRPRVLVVDDDVDVAGLVKMWLEKHDFEVTVATDGLTGLRRLYRLHPDLVVLDISVSRIDGWELCRRIRELDEDVPIIVLTAKAEMSYRVRAFELGADDYLTKPCELGELLARIRAILRRVRLSHGSSSPDRVYRHGDLILDLESHQVTIGGRRVDLSPTEFKLLAFLIQNQGRVVGHADILTNVWGPEYRDQVAYVKLYVRYLREKIESDPSNPQLILTERGFGYRFARPVPHLMAALPDLPPHAEPVAGAGQQRVAGA